MSLHALDVELIFQADGQAMQRPDWFLVLRIVCVKALGGFDGGIKEDFVQTIELLRESAMISQGSAARYLYLQADAPMQLCGRRPWSHLLLSIVLL